MYLLLGGDDYRIVLNPSPRIDRDRHHYVKRLVNKAYKLLEELRGEHYICAEDKCHSSLC